MHTASISQPLTVLTSALADRLHKVNAAKRQLAEHHIKIVGQDLHAAERPLLFIAHEPPRESGLRLGKLGKRKDGVHVLISRFGDVDVAWPAERVS